MKDRRLKRAKRRALENKIITFLFLYFICFTIYFSMLTLSKYVGTAKGNGGMPIAKWEVLLDTSDNESDILNIVVGSAPKTYTVKLTSISDVKAVYSIALSNVPNDLEVKLDDGEYQLPINNTINFNQVGYINANDETKIKEHTLTFNVPIDSTAINENEINIDVTFSQESPKED